MAFEIPTVFRQTNQLQMTSQVLLSHRMHPDLKQRMLFFTCNVTNGSQIPDNVPFGVFAEIVNRQNGHQSELQVWVENGYYDNNVQFREQKSNLARLNKYICKAHQIIQIVPLNSLPLTGNDVWDSNVQNYDESHDVRRTIYVDETNVITRGVFDEALNTEHTVTEELVAANVAEAASDFPVKLVNTTGTKFDYIRYEEIRCGWYLKTTEEMDSTEELELFGTRNHYWPSVLEDGPSAAALTGEYKDENHPKYGEYYDAAILISIRMKESYSGPCVATLTLKWSSTIPTKLNSTPDMLVTDAFANQGIFSNWSVPACLHYAVTWNELVGTNHPVLKDNQVRNVSFPATSETVWPSSVTLPGVPKPYKGGYLIETWEIDAPV